MVQQQKNNNYVHMLASSPEKKVMIMKEAKGENLLDSYINGTYHFHQDLLLFLVKQTIQAHEAGIALDLHPSNIFVDNGHYRFIDYSLLVEGDTLAPRISKITETIDALNDWQRLSYEERNQRIQDTLLQAVDRVSIPPSLREDVVRKLSTRHPIKPNHFQQ